MIGIKLSPILKEIEYTLWEFEANNSNQRPQYTDEALRSALKIFMSVKKKSPVLMWKRNSPIFFRKGR